MSSKLKPVDLTGAVVGTTGIINFTSFEKFAANDVTQKAHIRILNESGCGLDTTFTASGNYHFLPAGGWGTFDVEPNDSAINITVTYTLPNPPVSMVQAIYYPPGEAPPQSFTLGNSPIGIGGTISVTNVTALSNETNPINTLIIDLGIPGNTNLVNIYNDHFVWKVLQAGVVHTVLTGSTSGNPLQLGQLGDIVEALGSLTVDQNAVVTGTLATGTATFNNGTVLAGGDHTMGGHNVIGAGNVQATTVQTATINEAGNANPWASVTNGGPTRIQSTGAGQAIALQVPGGTTVLTIVANQIQMGAGTTLKLANNNTMQGVSNFTGAATGTYSHNFGSAPFFVIPMTSVSGSQSMGYDTITSTQVHITSFSGLAFKCFCFG